MGSQRAHLRAAAPDRSASTARFPCLQSSREANGQSRQKRRKGTQSKMHTCSPAPIDKHIPLMLHQYLPPKVTYLYTAYMAGEQVKMKQR